MTVTLPAPPAFGAPLPQRTRPEVLEFLALRRSTSAVALCEPGPSADEIEALLRLAARVPDHGKLSPWRFIVLDAAGKPAFAAALEALARARGDDRAAAKLAKLKTPPMGVAVVACPSQSDIPEWEQLLSAGAVCTTLLYAAQAMGYGANWITDWYAYDPDAKAILGLTPGEQVAGFVLIGSAGEPPLERVRGDPVGLTSVWRP